MPHIPIHPIIPSRKSHPGAPNTPGAPHSSSGSLNLTGLPLLGPLLRHPGFIGSLRLLSVTLLILAITLGIWGEARKTSLTLLLFWGLFWPLFTCLTTPSLGPVFCALCPHGALGKWLQPLGQNRPLPQWLRGVWVSLGLLTIGYWLLAFATPGLLGASARNTGLYFLGFTLIALLCLFRYKHMAYCTHLCPLGRLLAVHGKAGGLHIRTQQSACQRCTSFECAKACHYHLSPFNFQPENNTKNCTLCLNCLPACNAAELHWQRPGKSLARPILRANPQDIWVILLIFAIAGVGIQFLHGLQNTGLRPILPWNTLGLWLNQTLSIDPAQFRFSGLLALLLAIGLTLPLTLLGYHLAARFSTTSPKNPWALGQSMAYALTPLAIIGLIPHPITLFATQHAHTLITETGLLLGQNWHITPLAQRGDLWLQLVKHLPWLGVLWTLYLSWQRAKLQAATPNAQRLIWLLGSTPVWLYTGILLTKLIALMLLPVPGMRH